MLRSVAVWGIGLSFCLGPAPGWAQPKQRTIAPLYQAHRPTGAGEPTTGDVVIDNLSNWSDCRNLCSQGKENGYCAQHYYFIEVPYRNGDAGLPDVREILIRIWDPPIGWVNHDPGQPNYDILNGPADSSIRFNLYKPGVPTNPAEGAFETYTFVGAERGDDSCCEANNIPWDLTSYPANECCLSSAPNCCDMLSGENAYIDILVKDTDVEPGHWVLGVDTSALLPNTGRLQHNDISGFKLWAGSTTDGGQTIVEELNIYQRYITVVHDPSSTPEPDTEPNYYNFWPQIPGGDWWQIDHYNRNGESDNVVIEVTTRSPTELNNNLVKLPSGRPPGDQEFTYRNDIPVIGYPDPANCDVTSVPDQGPYRMHEYRITNQIGTPVMFSFWISHEVDGLIPDEPNATCNFSKPPYNIYHPANSGGEAPIKPYVAQAMRFERGKNPPVQGEANQYAMTVYFRNPVGSKGTAYFDPNPPSGRAQLVHFDVPNGPAGVTQVYRGLREVDPNPPYDDPNPSVGTYLGPVDPGFGWDVSRAMPTACTQGQVCGQNYRIEYVIETVWNSPPPICTPHAGDGADGEKTYVEWSDETVTYQLPGGGTGSGGLPPTETEGDDSVPTRASIAKMWAMRSDERAVAHFHTAGEVGTVAYRVLRLGDDGELTQVGAHIPSAANRPQGGAYAVEDPALLDGAPARYVIEEIGAFGFVQRHGPFVVPVARANKLNALPRGISTRPLAISTLTRERRARRAEVTPPRPFTWQSALPQRARISVDTGGLHRLTYDEIGAALGMSTGDAQSAANDAGLRLKRGSAEVAYLASPTGLLFFARDVIDHTVAHDVYWLTTGAGTTMGTINRPTPAAPSGVTQFTDYAHFEEDLRAKTTQTLEPTDSYWMWLHLLAGVPDQDTATLPFELPALATTEPATLFVNLESGNTTGAHHLLVRVNGELVAERTREYLGTWNVRAELTPGILTTGANELELEVVLDSGVAYSIVYLDSFDVRFGRHYTAVGDEARVRAGDEPVLTVDGLTSDQIFVFDVSRDWDPQVVTAPRIEPGGNGYAVTFEHAGIPGPFLVTTAAGASSPAIEADIPSTLSSADNGYEYLAITRRDMFAAAEELVELRREQGLSGMVIDVQDIYDEFSGGRAKPGAIRDFLSHAVNRWRTPPRYVVFAGDGSYDHRNIGGADDCVIPPFMVYSSTGLFASDTVLSDLSGGDGIPEVAIGRIPVLNNDELRTYVNKVKRYEAAASEPWAGYALLVADDPDGGGAFTARALENEPILSERFNVSSVLMEDHPLDSAREFLQKSLRTGARVTHFTGHGGMDRLASEGLLTLDDVDSLGNDGKPTVLITASCLVGRFGAPGVTSLSEALILSPNAGAVAVLGSVGLEYTRDSSVATREILTELAGESARLGDAFRLGLGRSGAQVGRNTLELFTMLGDPALQVFPAAGQIIDEVGGGVDSGCGCDATAPAWLALLALGALGIRRRRK